MVDLPAINDSGAAEQRRTRQMIAADLAWIDLLWMGCTLLGLVVTAFGVRALRADRALLAHGLRVPGVVAQLRIEEDRSDGTTFAPGGTYPVLRFTTLEGDEVESVTPVQNSKLKVRLGQRVTVVYDPQNPKRRPRIDTVAGRGLWFGMPRDSKLDDPGVILLGLMSVLVGVGVGCVRLWGWWR
jgi:Protein of unknown function (DUF3592)